jgi:hypothetical protein
VKIPELGGAIASVRLESHYLEFQMAQSVQGWRKKWFYIKDQKSSDSDQYGLAPFDASKGLKKLTTWDALPSEAKVESIKPLLARIQGLKSAAGGRTHRNATYGVVSSESHSTATISNIQVVDLLWFDQSFSSVCSGPRGKGSRQEG